MNFIVLSLILLAHVISAEDSTYNFTGYVKSYGYPVESHEVETEDGYLLTVFRIQGKQNKEFNNELPVILLQHGILDDADTWIVNSDPIENAPAFFFADKGYDVWLSNSRGSFYSRKHVKLNPDSDAAYWSFSFEKMGEKDLPAVLSRIDKFNKGKVNYVGHSQGTSIMFYALASQLKEVESRINNFFALAPVVYLGNMSSPLLKRLGESSLPLGAIKLLGIHEILGRTWLNSKVGSLVCEYVNFLCTGILELVSDQDTKFMNSKRLDVVMEHYPAGSSVMAIEHYLQLEKSRKFQKFDFGSAAANLAVYNSTTPPEISVSSITKNIYAYAGTFDELADINDVMRLKNELGSKLDLTIYEKFGHSSFVWGKSMEFLSEIHNVIHSQANKSFEGKFKLKKFLERN